MEGTEGTGRKRKQEAEEGEVEKENPKNTQCVSAIV